jgi:glutamate synthase domain-containing protein 3
MNSGRIVIHGMAGDLVGYAMRGGRIFIRGDVGYRVGIHMKSFKKQIPVVVVGGKAGDFFGEYMAGGTLVVLGLDSAPTEPLAGDYLGTGMHGGVIYIRGSVDPERLGKEVSAAELTDEDYGVLDQILKEYCESFGLNAADVESVPFTKLVPTSHRPYGNLYAY